MCVYLIGQEQKTHLLGEYLWESACIGKWKQAVYSPFAEEGGKFEVAGRGEEMASFFFFENGIGFFGNTCSSIAIFVFTYTAAGVFFFYIKL